MARAAADRLAAIDGVELLTPRDRMATLVTFRIRGWDAATALAPYSATQLAGGLSVVIAISAVAVYLSWRLYFSLSGDFAEEL